MQDGILLVVRGEVLKRSEGIGKKGAYRRVEVGTRRGAVSVAVDSAEAFATVPPEGSECAISCEVSGLSSVRNDRGFTDTVLGALKFVRCEAAANGAAPRSMSPARAA